MNFGDAAMLVAGTYGAIALVIVILAWIFTDGDADRIDAGPRVIVCLAVAIGFTYLMAATEFAGDTVIMERRLDSISGWGLLLVGVFLAFVEAAVYIGYEKLIAGLKNMGQNQLDPEERELQVALMSRAATAPLTHDGAEDKPDTARLHFDR